MDVHNFSFYHGAKEKFLSITCDRSMIDLTCGKLQKTTQSLWHKKPPGGDKEINVQ
jgi:hypothetical protein